MPKSARLRDVLRQSLLKGQWKPDERLPSEADLATQYQISRSTAREAILALVQEGVLYRIHGKGTFVASSTDTKIPAAAKLRYHTFALMLPFLFFTDSSHTRPFEAGTDFLPRLMQSIEGEARRAQSNILLYLNNRLSARERENVDNVLQRKVDGVLMNCIDSSGSLAAAEKIQEAGIPVLMLDRYFEERSFDFVVTDNALGAYCATKRLIAQGFERVIHVTSPGDHSSRRDRRRGYERAMEETGNVSQVLVVGERTLDETGVDRVSEEDRAYQLARTLFEIANPPFAIFATEAPILAGLWRAFCEHGLPHDQVAFACFDEPFIRFPETVFSLKVIQSYPELARRSIEALLQRVEKTGPREPFRIFVEPKIVTSKV